jgi:nicotinamidase/pyrazinamidase
VRDPQSGEESATELGSLLREAAVERLVVTGLAGDVCVAATAHDGVRLGFEVTVPLAATRMVELEAGDGERAVAELTEAGVEVVSA